MMRRVFDGLIGSRALTRPPSRLIGNGGVRGGDPRIKNERRNNNGKMRRMRWESKNGTRGEPVPPM